MVPTFDKFMYPILKLLSDGKTRTNKEIQDIIAQDFSLTQADLEEKTNRGGDKFKGNINWALTFLYQAGLTKKPKKGYHEISDSGRGYLAEGISRITERELIRRFGHISPVFFAYRSDPKEINTDKVAEPTAITPEDSIHQSIQMLEEALISELLQMVKKVSPADFEKLVVQLLVKMGYGGSMEDAASVTRYTNDEGIDGMIKEDVLGLDTIYLQAKRYTNTVVGRPELQAFVGALSPKHAKKGVFITTSTFSPQAIEFAKAAEARVILIDGHQLCKYMVQFGLGVTTRETIELKSIDSDYFDFE